VVLPIVVDVLLVPPGDGGGERRIELGYYAKTLADL